MRWFGPAWTIDHPLIPSPPWTHASRFTTLPSLFLPPKGTLGLLPRGLRLDKPTHGERNHSLSLGIQSKGRGLELHGSPSLEIRKDPFGPDSRIGGQGLEFQKDMFGPDSKVSIPLTLLLT
jgi:hypothetical protein